MWILQLNPFYYGLPCCAGVLFCIAAVRDDVCILKRRQARKVAKHKYNIQSQICSDSATFSFLTKLVLRAARQVKPTGTLHSLFSRMVGACFCCLLMGYIGSAVWLTDVIVPIYMHVHGTPTSALVKYGDCIIIIVVQWKRVPFQLINKRRKRLRHSMNCLFALIRRMERIVGMQKDNTFIGFQRNTIIQLSMANDGQLVAAS